MGKITHTELVYRELCYKKLKKTYLDKPDEIEKILFLMQYDALRNGRKPVYKYRTYIEDNKIRIKYMSDLLRVMTLTDIAIGRTNVSFADKEYIQENKEHIQEYIGFSNEKLDEVVNWVVKDGVLAPKYFTFKKYNNKIMRLFARFQNWFINHHALKGYVFVALTMFLLAMLVCCAVLISIFMSLGKEYYDQTMIVIKGLITIVIIAFIPWLALTIKITRPTKYEKEIKIQND